MKIFRYLLLIVSLFCISNANSQEKKLHTENDGFKWYEIKKNNYLGVQDSTGKTIIKLNRKYDDIWYSNTSGGWFGVSQNDKDGVCDKNGKVLLKPKKYDEVSLLKVGDTINESYVFLVKIKDQYDHFKMGVCNKFGKIIIPTKYESVSGTISNNYIVKLNGQYGVLDSHGKEIFPPQCISIDPWLDNYFILYKNYAKGIIDITGKLIIPVEYRNVSNWDNSFPYIQVRTFDNHYGVYSIYGDTIIPPYYSYIGRNISNYNNKEGFWVKNDEGYYGFYSNNGELLLPTSSCIDNIDGYDDYCIVNSGNTAGVINNHGMFIIPLGEYTQIYQRLSNGCYLARKDGIMQVIDAEGYVRLTTQLRNIQYDKEQDNYSPITEKVELFKTNDTTCYKVVDKLGRFGVIYGNKLIIEYDYDNILYKDDYFYVNKNGYWGVYNKSGNMIFPANNYHSVVYIKDDDSYITVKKNSKWGALSLDGKVIIEPQEYTNIGTKKNTRGHIYVQKGNYCGECDMNGNVVIPPHFTRISIFTQSKTNNEYLVENGNMVGLCNTSGNFIIHPIYNDIKLTNDLRNKDFQYYKVYSGKYIGIYTLDGKMIFPADQYTNVYISQNRIHASDNDNWHYEFSLDGKLLSDGQANYKSKQYNKFFDDAGNYFNKGKYKKALGCYKKALAYKQNATVYFNIGASYYNLGKYYDAIKYYEICLDHEPSLVLADKAKNSINKARKNIQIKEIRRQEAIQAAIGGVLGVTTAILQANNPAYNNDSYYNPYSNNNYLLDPNYAMWQTEQQNQLEYAEFSRTWKKPDGSNYTYQEFLGIKAQSLAGYQQQNNNGSSVSDSNISQSSTQTNTPSANKPCPRCNGKGRIVYDTYPPMFGLQDSKVKCNECGEYHLKSTGHTHITCPLCHGKGHN